MKRPHFSLFHPPGTIENSVLRVRLDSGDVFDLSCFSIRAIHPLVSCCGERPICEVEMDRGAKYRVDHPPSELLPVWAAWQRGTDGVA